jgi:hypothetical protein
MRMASMLVRAGADAINEPVTINLRPHCGHCLSVGSQQTVLVGGYVRPDLWVVAQARQVCVKPSTRTSAKSVVSGGLSGDGTSSCLACRRRQRLSDRSPTGSSLHFQHGVRSS